MQVAKFTEILGKATHVDSLVKDKHERMMVLDKPEEDIIAAIEAQEPAAICIQVRIKVCHTL